MCFSHVDEFAFNFFILILNIFFNLALFFQEPFKITVGVLTKKGKGKDIYLQ